MPQSSTRVKERDLVLPTLEIAASRPGGAVTTTELIAELEERFRPEGQDSQLLDGRRDTYFSQKVRNLVSHRDSNFMSQGLAVHDNRNRAIVITQAGRDYLDTHR